MPPSEEDLLGCRMVDLERHAGARGTLTVLLGAGGGGIDPRRAFLLTDVPPGAQRGGHAHRRAHQLVVAVAGELDALVGDGARSAHVRLVGGGPALAVPPLVWLVLSGFGPGAAALVLGSEPHDEADAIRSLEELAAVRGA